jgi:flagellar biosynthesis protein FlhF
MKIKSYFARTVEDAIALAARELGPDAMLLNSRRATPESQHPGEYEVTFAAETRSEAPAGLAPAARCPAPAHQDHGETALLREVAELRKELDGMRRSISRSMLAPNWVGAPHDVSEAYARLVAADVAPELAREIVEGAAARTSSGKPPTRGAESRRSPSGFQRALADEAASHFRVEPQLGRNESQVAIAALVGPPGAGKTTTLVKLAVNYGLAARRPALLLSLDTYRIAAAEQLRSYAAILGVGFQVLDTTTALAQAIEENRGKELVLIDTPGLGFDDLETAAPLAQFLSTRNDIDTHLVLPASMKPADLTRVADAFRMFQPNRLMFTKLDETRSFGPILTEAARTSKALSFFTTGQRIPEDLEEVTRKRLWDLILEPTAATKSKTSAA